MHDDGWLDPSHPPVEPAIDLGHGVWASWAAPWSRPEDTHPVVWHFCPRTHYRAARDAQEPSEADRMPEWYEEQWVAVVPGGHAMHSRDPLHLEPSLAMGSPGGTGTPAEQGKCCDLHGHVRGGRWEPC